jgi:hypothetical protein
MASTPQTLRGSATGENYADYGADLDKRAEHGAELFVEANKFLEQCSHSEWGAWDVLPANDWTLGDHITEFSDCFYRDGKRRCGLTRC